MTFSPTQKRHVDTERVLRVVGAIAAALDAKEPRGFLIRDFMHIIHASSVAGDLSNFDLTDDEPFVADQLMGLLNILLRDPFESGDLVIAEVIYGMLSHGRWRRFKGDHDSFFNIMAAVAYLAENVIASSEYLRNVFGAIAEAFSSAGWPFPGHAGIDGADLRAGQFPVLQCLCDGAFGSAWWQLIVPEVDEVNVALAILSTRPSLLHFASPACDIVLPELTASGAT
jgi:hypothetical protein